MTTSSPVRVALIGECMLELQGEALGAMTQSFGGDTLNTAVYLARCGGPNLSVSYATALGDDRFSSLMMDAWSAEGIELDMVRRLPGRLPGLYMIELNEAGERSFSYWRDSAAARDYFNQASTPLEQRVGTWNKADAFYLSGISLAILPPAGRERLFALMHGLRERGVRVVFDNNYRPRLWPDTTLARTSFERAFELASVALVTADDHELLFDGADARALPTPELLIKRGAASTLVREPGGAWQEAAAERVEKVVDTTAAGDSFAAGYLARRLHGASALDAASFGNRLAARVIQHRGALIPREVMSDLLPPT